MIVVRLVDESGCEYFVNPNSIDSMYLTNSGKTHITTTAGVVIVTNDTLQTVLNSLPRDRR